MLWGTRSKRGWWGHRRTARRGAAVVETAVVAPLVLTMIFGVMEFGWVFMIQQSTTNAVREACRVGVLPGATDNDISQRFVQAMEGSGIEVAPEMVTIEHPTEGNPILTVRAALPYANVSLLGSLPWCPSQITVTDPETGQQVLRDRTIGSACSMHKEGV